MSNRFIDQVKHFHRIFDHPIAWDSSHININMDEDTFYNLDLRQGLIDEEATKLYRAIDNMLMDVDEWGEKDEDSFNERKKEVLNGICDLIFVAIRTALMCGFNIEEAMERVYDSNMSKLGENGNPIYWPNGKVKKGSNYFPPRLDDLVD